MKFSFAIALVSCLLVSLHHAPAAATAQLEGKGKAVVMENDFVRLVIDPDRGGAVVSYVYKPTNREVVRRDRRYMGLFMDHFWGQNWPGELLETPYELQIEQNGPEAVVKLWRTVRGDWQAEEQKFIQGLMLEKTFVLKSDSATLNCHIAVRNPTKEARLPAYWCQNVFFIGGDYDSEKDVFYRPSARGVKATSFASPQQDEFLQDPAGGWSAAVDTVKGDGLLFLVNYNDLDMLYNSRGNHSLEWMFDKIPVPAGRSWETDISLLPITGFESVAHASSNFLSQIDAQRRQNSVTLNHQLRAVSDDVQNLSLTTKVVGAVDHQEALLPALSVGTVTAEGKSISQEAEGISGDPLAILVKATGQVNGKEFKEEYFYFYLGGWGYGGNVQQDLITPLFKVPLAPKKQELMRPEKIVRVRASRPQVFIVRGLQTDVYRLDEAMQLFGAESRTGEYSSGTEGPRVTDFPLDYDTLLRQDVIIISNANLQCLGKLGLMILRDYLTHGGNLLLLGGKNAYGNGGLNGSGLEELLPIEVDSSLFDIRRLDSAVFKTETKHPVIAGLDWATASGTSLYLHQTKVKNNCETLLTASGNPLLVIGEIEGGGHIACLLAAPYGDEKDGSIFASADWPRFMSNLLAWLSR